MATATYVPLATTTLGSATNTITFSSIPSGYTDLRVVLNTTYSGATNDYAYTRFNGDSGANYSYTTLYAYNGSAYTEGYPNTTSFSGKSNGPQTNPQVYIYDIFSYTGSTYKTSLYTQSSDLNGSTSIVGNFVSLWRNTSAITSISFTTQTGNFAAGTTATLWGI
jgi:hypothetical protein